VTFTAGLTSSAQIDYGFSYTSGPLSWRTPIAIQLIFAIIVVLIVFGLPESPRWLAKRGRIDEALEVLCAVYDLPPDDEYVQSEMESIRAVLALEQHEGAQKWSALFKNDILKTRELCHVGRARRSLLTIYRSTCDYGMVCVVL